MHELGIARDIVRRAVEEAARHEATRIQALHIVLGPVGSVNREALAFGVQAASHWNVNSFSRLFLTRSLT